MTKLDQNFWDQRYANENTPWDIGSISPPIKFYIDNIKNKEMRILIPGAGYGHEAAYLWELGFKHVFVCDWSSHAAEAFLSNNPTFPKAQFIVGDFFTIQHNFELIIEQTFFCALPRHFRPLYASKMSNLLSKGGKLVGLFFSSEFEKEGPPFGGTLAEYKSLFSDFFSINQFEKSNRSIGPRLGNELFAILEKKPI